MGFFLAGHGAFIAAFGQVALGAARRALTLLPIGVYALVVLRILYPSLGALRVPVIVYVVGLAAMAWRACLAAQDRARPGPERVALALGGILFIAADTVLAMHKFHGAIPHEKALAMPLYWASLSCLALSMGSSRRPSARSLADPHPEAFGRAEVDPGTGEGSSSRIGRDLEAPHQKGHHHAEEHPREVVADALSRSDAEGYIVKAPVP
jgi:hypothetical protein